MPSTVWIQFAKAPKLGTVKTRLAATIGEEAALAAHNSLTLAVNRQLQSAYRISVIEACEVWLAVAGQEQDVEMAGSFYVDRNANFDRLLKQPSGDLGERMHTLLQEGLNSFDYAFIVGSDFPVLDATFLKSAVTALDEADVVLAPTTDGGYGLIGVRAPQNRKPLPEFGLIDWGAEQVLDQTKTRFESFGLVCVDLEKRYDVDDEIDWRKWLSSPWYSKLDDLT